MISSKNIQLVITVTLACIIVPVLAAEPNKPNEQKPKLKFETSIETMTWTIVVGKTDDGKPMYYNDPGPVKPSYVAKVLLHESYPMTRYATTVMDYILESPIAKKFSSEQQKFFKTELVARIDSPDRIPFYYSTWLYATSQEDARLMVQAYIDGLNKNIEKGLSNYKLAVSEHQQKLDKAQKEFLEKQKQLKEVEQSYQNIKEATHQFSSDTEAYDLAKTSIVEMDKTLNALDIELAGIREKLKTIEKYRNEPNLRDKDKLDEMYIELMIELSGLEARRKVTEQIRAREQEFMRLFNRLGNLRHEVGSLESSIKDSKRIIKDYTDEIDNPRTSMQPPKVYQDTVTIYPVLTDN